MTAFSKDLLEPWPWSWETMEGRWEGCAEAKEPEGWRLVEEEVWQPYQEVFETAMTSRLSRVVEKRLRHESDPTVDFLFEYYSFSAGALSRWTPGLGVVLRGPKARLKRFLKYKGFVATPEGVAVDPRVFSDKKLQSLRWIRELLAVTNQRPPSFGCFGLHEWAMVYRTEEIRHTAIPLRVEPATIAGIVEARPLSCTHFDAFRFFTQAAQPLNRWVLDRESQPRHEQPGCLHASMDIYKWAYKIYPWIESELLGAAFLLACHARLLDMQASPYDLQSYGISAIPIETDEGRLTYQARQKAIAAQAIPLRQRLLQAYDRLLAACG